MTDDNVTAPEQKELIPLTEEELLEAPRQLANYIKELEDLEAEHKEVREEHSAERKRVRGRIASLAQQIRQQGR